MIFFKKSSDKRTKETISKQQAEEIIRLHKEQDYLRGVMQQMRGNLSGDFIISTPDSMGAWKVHSISLPQKLKSEVYKLLCN